MKFVDSASVHVQAGNGGHGCSSFHREKFVPFGGPDGGDGGDGGSVYLRANSQINTLVDFRYRRQLAAKNGQGGQGRQRSGKKGLDCIFDVPVGTIVADLNTHEVIGDLAEAGQLLLVAQGGRGGLGNVHFKSSINQAPRKVTKGTQGEMRHLHLELKVLADVGLVGLPNAGKSTFVRAVSAAKPKVADYPFTTLHPHLGVVSVATDQSFVVADIPGLIAGAAEGVGLGHRFLKHIARTQLLLHLVDLGADPDVAALVEQVQIIEQELIAFDPELLKKARWLILNKADLFLSAELPALQQSILSQLQWTGPVYLISAISGMGTKTLSQDIMRYLRGADEDDES